MGARRLMRQSVYKHWVIGCDGGRINRIRWRCQVSVRYHQQCLRTRIQVYGAGYRDHGRYYGATAGKLRRCR